VTILLRDFNGKNREGRYFQMIVYLKLVMMFVLG